MSIDLNTIFEAPPPPDIEFEDEVRAIKAGAKSMSVFLFPKNDLLEDESCRLLLNQAWDAGLIVGQTIESHGKEGQRYDEVRVFVFKSEDSWRMTAYLALHDAFRFPGCSWSDGAEVLESKLLGYPDQATWMKTTRYRQSGWGMGTMYFLMPSSQRVRFEATGMRSFPAESLDHLTLFYFRGHQVIRRDAYDAFDDFDICRVGVHHRLLLDLFKECQATDTVASVHVAAQQATKLNCGLESKIETLTIDGWK